MGATGKLKLLMLAGCLIAAARFLFAPGLAAPKPKPPEQGACCKSTIWRIKADGTEAVRLSKGSESDSSPVPSPDGKWLAFTMTDPDTLSSNLWLMKTDGSERRQLTKLNLKAETVFLAPSWSTDSQNIVFAVQIRTKIPPLISHIYRVGINGQGLKKLDEGYSPSWSPDGKKIAFNGEKDSHLLSIMNADGSGRTLLGDNGDINTEFAATWSPDSQHLAFSHTFFSTPPNGPSIVSFHRQICIVDVADKTIHKLMEGQHAVWSPDGRRLAFVDREEYSLYVMDADTHYSTLLPATNAFQPVWSPNGRQIAYSTINGKSNLFVINADGSGKRQLTADRGGDREVRYSPDGKYIFFTRYWGFFAPRK